MYCITFYYSTGQHGFIETNTPEVDLLIKEIQKTLSGFIEYNHDAWAPQIARVCIDELINQSIE